MRQYLGLVDSVIKYGTRKENRTGVDTLSTFGQYYEHDLKEGFPILTTKEVSWRNIVIEMLWFLSGRTDVGILRRHGCRFWDPWVDPETGKVPSAYGSFWRAFPTHGEGYRGDPKDPDQLEASLYNDQIRWVTGELLRNPMSRRMVVSAWAPDNAQHSKLPPCHCMFVLNVQNEARNERVEREIEGQPDAAWTQRKVQRLCLHLTQRSCDVALGVPYNLASYGLLLHLFARFSGLEPGIFAHSLVDAHVYTCKPDGTMLEHDHVPGLREQLQRKPLPLPRLVIDESVRCLKDVEDLMRPSVSTEEVMSLFRLEGYEHHPAIPFKVAV